MYAYIPNVSLAAKKTIYASIPIVAATLSTGSGGDNVSDGEESGSKGPPVSHLWFKKYPSEGCKSTVFPD